MIERETGRFIIAIAIITWICTMLTIGAVNNVQIAVDLIKWIFITYCTASIGENIVGKLKK